jgi:hypothetical protein
VTVPDRRRDILGAIALGLLVALALAYSHEIAAWLVAFAPGAP